MARMEFCIWGDGGILSKIGGGEESSASGSIPPGRREAGRVDAGGMGYLGFGA